MDDTLSNDAWKDSFDKMMEKSPLVRKPNLLKKENVRASYNFDSSVENSADASGLLIPLPSKKSHISTPLINRLTVNPFNCAISPIGMWRFDYYDNSNPKTDNQDKFMATAVNSGIVINYDDKSNDVGQAVTSGSSLISPLPKKRVCFQAVENRQPTKKAYSNPVKLSEKRESGKERKKRNDRPTWHHLEDVQHIQGISGSTNAATLLQYVERLTDVEEHADENEKIVEAHDNPIIRDQQKKHVCFEDLENTKPKKKAYSNPMKHSVKRVSGKERKKHMDRHTWQQLGDVQHIKTISGSINSATLLQSVEPMTDVAEHADKNYEVVEAHDYLSRDQQKKHVCFEDLTNRKPKKNAYSNPVKHSEKRVSGKERKKRNDRPTCHQLGDVQDYDENNEIVQVEAIAAPIISGQQKKRVCFEASDSKSTRKAYSNPLKRISKKESVEDCKKRKERSPKSLTLQPGKWRKSLSQWRRRTHTLAVIQQILPSVDATDILRCVINNTDNDNENNEVELVDACVSPVIVARPRKHVCFETSDNSKPSKKAYSNPLKSTSKEVNEKDYKKCNERSKSLALQTGKWRKSTNNLRRTHQLVEIQQVQQIIETTDVERRVLSVEQKSVVAVGGKRKSIQVPDFLASADKKSSPILSNESDWRQKVLDCCEQQESLSFDNFYASTISNNCRKIGEGVYGEVFLNSGGKFKRDIVLKIIPIEGSKMINGEVQKTYEQILPEIVISKELCNLRNKKLLTNSTAGFVGLEKVSLVQGAYPEQLIELWEKYDDEKESENDHPELFSESQLFVVLELQFAGEELASFKFSNAEQAYYVLQQIILTLAVGEEAFQFEHRDLHWGNILVLNTSRKQISYKLNNNTLTLPTKGVKITIIDYTLSRMTYSDYCLYNDLSSDEELFVSTGDYQFDIYRMMRDLLKNNWEQFAPKTNVFWISYIITKMIDGINYKHATTKLHALYIEKLKQLRDIILNFNSAVDCAQHLHKMS